MRYTTELMASEIDTALRFSILADPNNPGEKIVKTEGARISNALKVHLSGGQTFLVTVTEETDQDG